MASVDRISQLVEESQKGSRNALDELTPLVLPELRRIARAHLRGERPDHTLQPTALVNEAYIRLLQQRDAWEGRAHFLSIAAGMMRRILVDHARKRRTKKRAWEGRVTLHEELVADRKPLDLLALNAALDKLATLDPRQARLVEFRYFAGLTIEETATALGVAPVTVTREWKAARAWLRRELGRSVTPEP